MMIRTRQQFPDLTPNEIGEDTFSKMAQRGNSIIDRVVNEELSGKVDLEKDVWIIPRASKD